ncbi:unnamed protein product [Caretta caretta]
MRGTRDCNARSREPSPASPTAQELQEPPLWEDVNRLKVDHLRMKAVLLLYKANRAFSDIHPKAIYTASETALQENLNIHMEKNCYRGNIGSWELEVCML